MKKPLKVLLQAIVLDCADADALADFYAALLGWTKDCTNPEWISVSDNRQMPYLLFQQTEDYAPPHWPHDKGDQQQMAHMDFVVNDIEAAIAHTVGLGGSIAPEQFSNEWQVMLDPAGHPFCLLQRDWV